MTRYCLFATVLLTAFSSGNAQDFDIVVFNKSEKGRSQIVEVSRFPSDSFVLTDENGKEMSYQITYDSKLIFNAEIPANSSKGYLFRAGTPTVSDTICYGRVFPERKDDLAWENDRAAYRAYGPALQASGEKAYGYDIWTKSVAYPILEKRFFDDIVNKISFHVDHGNGMDVYAVGPTLGGGSSAILTQNDSILYPYCWESVRILDKGPLRFTAELIYPQTIVGGDTIVEKRLISLDAGNWLNKTVVRYEGLRADLRPMAGIVVHDSNPNGFSLKDNMVTYCDLTQQPVGDNGEIYVALYSPDVCKPHYLQLNPNIGDAVGHVALIGQPGKADFTYYWGSGWSKGGVKDFDTWNGYISDFEEEINNPLIIKTK